ncbi:acyl-CoA dehydrogenase family protein [Parasphingorhabdus sp.]|uniref:acyl-CoA dehydrogenase family protein n=1 Tax=Parasphingorhabdus sp. TaxID=2709688 RepID=UPI003A9599F6
MTIELSELRDAAQKAFPADRLIPRRDESWQLIAEMGWLMLDLPEELGGLGLKRDAVATIHHEMGRVLPAAPLIPALLGLQAIAGSETLVDKTDWVERVCSGEYIPLPMLSAAVEKRDDGKYDGRIAGVFEADMASHILAGLGDVYALIPLDAPGVIAREQPLWDESRRLFDIELTGYAVDPSLVIAAEPAVQALHDNLSISAQLALSADSLGAAGALLELTVEYLKTRQQFDRPLAMFQALKHRVADLKVKLVAAEALFWSRTACDTTPLETGAIKAHATGVFREIAEESIQLHGGIGLTEEHPCHRFFKRAFLNCQLCGDADYWEEKTGRLVLDAS